MYLAIAIGGIIGSILAYFFRTPILIGGTSLMGSYLIVTGICFFIENIPSIIEIYDLIKDGYEVCSPFIQIAEDSNVPLFGWNSRFDYYSHYYPMEIQTKTRG